MDKKYWQEYYNKKAVPTDESLFARYVFKNYLKENDTLFEIGCGNGRDAVFFANNKIKVTAVDQCHDLKLKKELELKKGNLIKGDFTNLDNLEKKFNHVYSRFTLHSITKEEQDRTLKWVYKNIKKGGYFHIEVRGKKNELYKKGTPSQHEKDAFVFENHHRRFVDFKELKSDLENIGFEILYAKEKKGFSPFKNTDYVFIRIICQKK